MTPPASHPPVGAEASLAILARLAEHARRRPDAPAIREMTPPHPALTITWSELHRQALTLAAHLRAIDAPGRVLLLSSPNRAEFIVAFLAILMADAAVMPLHPRLAPPELLRVAKLTGAAAVIGTDEALGVLAALEIHPFRIETLLDHAGPAAPSAPPLAGGQTRSALLLQSSGTTGMPRTAFRSGRSLDAVATNVAFAAALSPADEVLACIPLCHSYGVENALLAPILAGSCIRLLDGFDPVLVPQCLEGGVSVFPGVPFMFEALARTEVPGNNRRRAAGTLRLAYSAGGAMPRAVAAQFQQQAGIAVGQLYGATEIGSVTFNHPASAGFDTSCVGVGLPGVRIVVLDPAEPDPRHPLPAGAEGHIAVAAPSMLDRYLDGDAPIVGGFFLTGDLGRIDDRARLWITGRLKLQIDVGGLKVNPAEVERALLEHPAVADCAVVAMPLSDTIARVRAVVVANAEKTVSSEDLRRFLGERLAPYKVPRLIEFRQALPRSPMGKLLRKELERS
jgi:long-chain acyl-CoA synthetase